MGHYRFRALNYSGQYEKGTVVADSLQSVRQILLLKQLVPVSIESSRSLIRSHRLFKWFYKPGHVSKASILTEDKLIHSGWLKRKPKPLNRTEIALLTKQLSLLVRSGIPVDHALLVLSEEADQAHVKVILKSVILEIQSGVPFSRAIATEPRSFDSLYQGVISAAEQSGNMGLVLSQLSDYLDKRQAVRQKVVGALIYPAVLTVVAFMIVLFLMAYVVPQITLVFESSNQRLPLTTQFILALSNLVIQWGWLIAIAVLGVIAVGLQYLKRTAVRLVFDRWLLGLPVVGPLILGFETARFAGTFSMLSLANVPLLVAMQSAKRTLGNAALQQTVNVAELRVKEGVSLSKALGNQGLFSPIFIHLIRAAEVSGKLPEMLKFAADNAELQSEQKTRVFTSLLEPILILVMGLMVLLIVMAVMEPILEMNTGIS